MPQFDFYSFSTQIFFVLLGFAIFHFLVLKFIVVPYSKVLKLRKKLFSTFLVNSTDSTNYSKSLYESFIFYVCLSSKL